MLEDILLYVATFNFAQDLSLGEGQIMRLHGVGLTRVFHEFSLLISRFYFMFRFLYGYINLCLLSLPWTIDIFIFNFGGTLLTKPLN